MVLMAPRPGSTAAGLRLPCLQTWRCRPPRRECSTSPAQLDNAQSALPSCASRSPMRHGPGQSRPRVCSGDSASRACRPTWFGAATRTVPEAGTTGRCRLCPLRFWKGPHHLALLLQEVRPKPTCLSVGPVVPQGCPARTLAHPFSSPTGRCTSTPRGSGVHRRTIDEVTPGGTACADHLVSRNLPQAACEPSSPHARYQVRG
mmetsp:Transcript_14447/g.31665  ORF Transcript_14447/g.31665 Transcript_14447/m.31665 type:complete len:203 (+) Transcript_14447:2163-2771(+)